MLALNTPVFPEWISGQLPGTIVASAPAANGRGYVIIVTDEDCNRVTELIMRSGQHWARV